MYMLSPPNEFLDDHYKYYALQNLVTLNALIWFLPGVYSHMLYKTIIIYERLATLAALVWIFLSVYFHVICKYTIP